MNLTPPWVCRKRYTKRRQRPLALETNLPVFVTSVAGITVPWRGYLHCRKSIKIVLENSKQRLLICLRATKIQTVMSLSVLIFILFSKTQWLSPQNIFLRWQSNIFHIARELPFSPITVSYTFVPTSGV